MSRQAVLVHIAVKLPIIRWALSKPLDDIPTGELTGPSRQTVLHGGRDRDSGHGHCAMLSSSPMVS